MTWLLTSDLHLTDRPEHAYRLEFLDGLYNEISEKKHTQLIILGDISDQKDRHSGVLVNAVADRIKDIAELCQVRILYGNHDGPSLDRPFWAFLHYIPNVFYYTTVMQCEVGKENIRCIFSPWSSEAEAMKIVRNYKQDQLAYMFMHYTAANALVENGTKMEVGAPARFLPRGSKIKVYSGDVHVPQKVGDVEYVGSPYHVHYGDGFEPRVVVLDPNTGRTSNLVVPGAPRLRTVRVPWSLDADFTADHVKLDRFKIVIVTVEEILPSDWHERVKSIRAHIESLGCTLSSVILERSVARAATKAPSLRRGDEAVVRTYSERQGYSEEIIDAGLALTKD